HLADKWRRMKPYDAFIREESMQIRLLRGTDEAGRCCRTETRHIPKLHSGQQAPALVRHNCRAWPRLFTLRRDGDDNARRSDKPSCAHGRVHRYDAFRIGCECTAY